MQARIHTRRLRRHFSHAAIASATVLALAACGGGGSGSGSGGTPPPAAPQYSTATSTLYAGSATAVGGYVNDAGNPLNALFNYPLGLAGDASGNLYVSEYNNNALRQIASAGAVTTYAGGLPPGGPGAIDDPVATNARFTQPFYIARASNGTLYVADYLNHCIRKVAPGSGSGLGGAVTTLAGLCGTTGYVNATGGTARFAEPTGLALDEAGNALYVSEVGTHAIRKIDLGSQAVTTFAGNAVAGPGAYQNGAGTAARFNQPVSLARDSQGNLYVSELGNHTIRKIDPAGNVSLLAGLLNGAGTAGVAGYANGNRATASFNNPYGLVADANGSVYVADTNNRVIRQIRPVAGGDVAVTTLAGALPTDGTTPAPAGLATGTGTAAQFASPIGMWLNGTGTLYVADTFANRILKLALQP